MSQLSTYGTWAKEQKRCHGLCPRGSPPSRASEADAPQTAIKQWDTCVQWTTRTQTNEEATFAPRADASREDSTPSKHTRRRTTASWQEGLWGTERDGALAFSKFNTHTPEPAHNGWHMNIFFIYINSVYSHSCVSGKKITSASNPGLHRYILYLETKFNLKRWTEVVVGKRKWTDKRNELQTPRSTIQLRSMHFITYKWYLNLLKIVN